jgi:hypothetical protein
VGDVDDYELELNPQASQKALQRLLDPLTVPVGYIHYTQVVAPHENINYCERENSNEVVYSKCYKILKNTK